MNALSAFDHMRLRLLSGGVLEREKAKRDWRIGVVLLQQQQGNLSQKRLPLIWSTDPSFLKQLQLMYCRVILMERQRHMFFWSFVSFIFNAWHVNHPELQVRSSIWADSFAGSLYCDLCLCCTPSLCWCYHVIMFTSKKKKKKQCFFKWVCFLTFFWVISPAMKRSQRLIYIRKSPNNLDF